MTTYDTTSNGSNFPETRSHDRHKFFEKIEKQEFKDLKHLKHLTCFRCESVCVPILFFFSVVLLFSLCTFALDLATWQQKVSQSHSFMHVSCVEMTNAYLKRKMNVMIFESRSLSPYHFLCVYLNAQSVASLFTKNTYQSNTEI